MMENEFLSLNEAAALLNRSSLDLLQQCADSGKKIAVAVKELPVISAENNREIFFEGICYIDDAHLRHAVHNALEDGYRPDIPGVSIFCEGTYLRIKSLMLCCEELIDLNRYYDHCIEIGRLLVRRSDINAFTPDFEKIVEEFRGRGYNDREIAERIRRSFPDISGEKISRLLWPDEPMVLAKSKARAVQRWLKDTEK